MICSDARLAANRLNATRSTGPKTPEGKATSRRNSLKHGMTGEGVVLPAGDQAEVERRFDDLRDELRPQSSLGTFLIRKIATFSVRSERAAERENAAIAERVRNAVDAFDEERGQRVDSLFAALFDDPSGALRNLRRMPEGVDRLLDDWRTLRRDLDREGPHRWGSPQMSRAVNLTGVRSEKAHSTRIGDLSSALWGEFHGLTALEGAGLDDQGRRDWARAALLELVDARIAELEAHLGTLDLERIEQDRLEAPTRATFDDSRPASLARRYEADADRGFYKALKEFRQVEAESPARVEAAPPPARSPERVPSVGSSRDRDDSADLDPLPPLPPRSVVGPININGPDGRPWDAVTNPWTPG